MPNKIDLHELSASLACIGTVGSDKPCESCPYYRGDKLECCNLVIADAITVIECLINYRGDKLECCNLVIADAITMIECRVKREQVDKRDR